MVLNFITVVLFIAGVLFLVIDFGNEAVRNKGFGMFCIISAAATMLAKLYLENQAEVNSFIKASLDSICGN